MGIHLAALLLLRYADDIAVVGRSDFMPLQIMPSGVPVQICCVFLLTATEWILVIPKPFCPKAMVMLKRAGCFIAIHPAVEH